VTIVLKTTYICDQQSKNISQIVYTFKVFSDDLLKKKKWCRIVYKYLIIEILIVYRMHVLETRPFYKSTLFHFCLFNLMFTYIITALLVLSITLSLTTRYK